MLFSIQRKSYLSLCVCFIGTSQTVSNKHVLIMDEVDGMAGNEDRGGIQVKQIKPALIKLNIVNLVPK